MPRCPGGATLPERPRSGLAESGGREWVILCPREGREGRTSSQMRSKGTGWFRVLFYVTTDPADPHKASWAVLVQTDH